MSDDELDTRPVYEFDQVVTDLELYHAMVSMYDSYQQEPWWNWMKRMKLYASFQTLRVFLLWLRAGKPQDEFMGDYDETVC